MSLRVTVFLAPFGAVCSLSDHDSSGSAGTVQPSCLAHCYPCPDQGALLLALPCSVSVGAAVRSLLHSVRICCLLPHSVYAS